MYADLAFENCERFFSKPAILIIRHVAYASAELIKSRKAVALRAFRCFFHDADDLRISCLNWTSETHSLKGKKDLLES